MDKEELGKYIKARRSILGISQNDLAEIAGISIRSLKDIETGKGNPTLEQLKKILGPLGLHISLEVNNG
ncbi:MAG: helix-turn-helix transcriptional regulator [Ignavibacteria bacterium]|jgi:transcriptional regulator with XRE-family HTH domain|nr:helix-turn-helix transcriptional regulator [Ignavibacteria bacterium]MCU7501048.1 helix-turn-helix transcriptional regulator [Ignavibacteria bacterium]MCU7514035.1 helix-turn-helix transcriptional regulator [Ignavibacteria bacterium]MCU7521192.1 helix-turn-helix transcriptional regulator [Ignavibacteria bacterium]MCU7526237.1 helix-turn-helix transcriptional regulator [Ignavibacteria bacterium]